MLVAGHTCSPVGKTLSQHSGVSSTGGAGGGVAAPVCSAGSYSGHRDVDKGAARNAGQEANLVAFGDPYFMIAEKS